MIQRFSLWKTIVVIVSLVLGTLYGLPNGFPDDPAVQITSNRSTEVLGELDVIRAEDASSARMTSNSPNTSVERFDVICTAGSSGKPFGKPYNVPRTRETITTIVFQSEKR